MNSIWIIMFLYEVALLSARFIGIWKHYYCCCWGWKF